MIEKSQLTLALLCLAFHSGCADTTPANEAVTAQEEQVEVEAPVAILRVEVLDDGLHAGGTAFIDIEAEIVLRHEQDQMLVGSWAIGRAVREGRGLSTRDFGPLEIGKKYVVLFTHARRDGSTVESSIELTPAFCVQGCTRDTLHVDVGLNTIELWGYAIHATGNKELEFRR